MRGLGDIIAALYKPMNYVSRNSFANLGVVKGLEANVSSLTKEALLLPLGPDKLRLIRELAKYFLDFDSLDLVSKKVRVIDSLRVLEQIEYHSFSPGPPEREVSALEFSEKAKELSMPIQSVKGVGL